MSSAISRALDFVSIYNGPMDLLLVFNMNQLVSWNNVSACKKYVGGKNSVLSDPKVFPAERRFPPAGGSLSQGSSGISWTGVKNPGGKNRRFLK